MKRLIYFALISIFLSACAFPKGNCGSKKDHKKRIHKTKQMAPKMMNIQ